MEKGGTEKEYARERRVKEEGKEDWQRKGTSDKGEERK